MPRRFAAVLRDKGEPTHYYVGAHNVLALERSFHEKKLRFSKPEENEMYHRRKDN